MNPAALSRVPSGILGERFDPQTAASEPVAPLRILLVEDNPRLRQILGFVLRRDGHEVIEPRGEADFLEILTSSGLVAGARAGQESFDLVISEHHLPGLLGLSILAAIRAFNRSLPFILMGGSRRVQAEAMRLGAVPLSPPLTVGGLRHAIRWTRDTPGGAVEPPGLNAMTPPASPAPATRPAFSRTFPNLVALHAAF